MIKLPPNHYCIIKNPVVRDDKNSLVSLTSSLNYPQVKSQYDEIKVRFEDVEVRTSLDYPDPFALYPYEEIHQDVKPFIFLKDSEALVLKASRPFKDDRQEGGLERFIDDEYLFQGPGTYIPRVEETIQKRIEVIIVLNNHGLLLKAKRDTIDTDGNTKKAGQSVTYSSCNNSKLVVTSQTRIFHAYSRYRGSRYQKGIYP